MNGFQNQTQVKVKICGLRREEDVEAVNEVLPEFAGFILHFPKSFRNISEETLRKLSEQLCPKITPVGVFVNADLSIPEKLLKEDVIRIAQLHGTETPEYVQELQERTGKPVIKAFSIRCEKDVEMALQSPADYILLDQGSGGTGQTFDWSLIPEMTRPYFLAGGLGTENIRKAIEELHPWAVDLSSSLETDGKKDREKIRQIMSLVR